MLPAGKSTTRELVLCRLVGSFVLTPKSNSTAKLQVDAYRRK
jgi:hypothetical protein